MVRSCPLGDGFLLLTSWKIIVLFQAVHGEGDDNLFRTHREPEEEPWWNPPPPTPPPREQSVRAATVSTVSLSHFHMLLKWGR